MEKTVSLLVKDLIPKLFKDPLRSSGALTKAKQKEITAMTDAIGGNGTGTGN